MSQDKPSVVSVVSVEVGGKECKGELEIRLNIGRPTGDWDLNL